MPPSANAGKKKKEIGVLDWRKHEYDGPPGWQPGGVVFAANCDVRCAIGGSSALSCPRPYGSDMRRCDWVGAAGALCLLHVPCALCLPELRFPCPSRFCHFGDMRRWIRAGPVRVGVHEFHRISPWVSFGSFSPPWRWFGFSDDRLPGRDPALFGGR